jgi:hypothetical protein
MQSQADFLLLRAHSFVLLAASSSAEGGMFSEKSQRVQISAFSLGFSTCELPVSTRGFSFSISHQKN